MKDYIKIFISICLIVLYGPISIAQTCDDNLVLNGDFSQGNGVGFGSDLYHSMFCQASSYAVVNEPRTKCPNVSWVDNLWDHTLGNASGRQLIIDSDEFDTRIWYSTNNIPVTSGHTYEFSFWHHRGISNPDDQTLEIKINGLLHKTILTINDPSDRWVKHKATWVAPSSLTNVPLEIWQTNSHHSDNDHSFDDIFFGENPGIGMLFQVTNTSCGRSNNGAIDITPTGGYAPLSFTWTKSGSGSFTASTEDISGLSVGTYNLTITDANNCTRTESYTVGTDPALSATASIIDARCDIPNTGSIDLSVNGGSPGYSFAWTEASSSFTANTEDISNVPVGNYQVTVTDQLNCQQTFNYVITTSAITVVFVDQFAQGNETGQSWTDAFTELQSAMELVRRGCANEIWVSHGVYNPAQEPIPAYVGSINHLQNLSEDEYFYEMIPGVGIFGGFDASTSPKPTSLNQRDWKTNLTEMDGIMSLPSGISVNTISLIRNIAVGIGPDAVLDGFILKNCNSENNGGVSHQGFGSQGAICMIMDSPTIRNCIFEDNRGDYGGAINAVGSSSIISYCIFRNNEVIAANAGAIYLSNGAVEIANCLFHDNKAEGSGGAMVVVQSQGDFIVNCTFTENESINGRGALAFAHSQLATISNCIMWRNYCPDSGFVSLYSYPFNSLPTLRNCNVENTQSNNPITLQSWGWDNKANIGTSWVNDELPDFVSPANNNFRLKDISPLRARGINNDIADFPIDLDGKTRIMPVSQGIVDLGCYENSTMPLRAGKPKYVDPVSEESAFSFSVFPNPSNGVFFLNGPISDIKNLKLIDMKGNIIINKSTVIVDDLDISGFNNGIYILQLINDAGETNIHRVVKN